MSDTTDAEHAEHEFGDADPEDSYVEEDVEMDSEQVAKRFHEVHADMAAFAEENVPGWEELEPDEVELALALGAGLVEQIEAHPEVDSAAVWMHTAREYIDANVPAWNDLDEDEQAVAFALMQEILDWLVLEGTIKP